MSEKNICLSEKTVLLIAMNKVLAKHYRELKKLPKPEQYKVGGTYYGRTELFSSVGNCLDFCRHANHTSYGYAGLNTYYENAFYLRIGGAYKYSKGDIAKDLETVLGGMYHRDFRIGVIDDYGTNYSVVGFGNVVH